MGGLGVNAGGFSKGASSIWPGGKPPSSKDLAAADEVFQSHKEVGAPTTKAPGASEVAAPKTAKDVQQAQH